PQGQAHGPHRPGARPEGGGRGPPVADVVSAEAVGPGAGCATEETGGVAFGEAPAGGQGGAGLPLRGVGDRALLCPGGEEAQYLPDRGRGPGRRPRPATAAGDAEGPGQIEAPQAVAACRG